MTRLRMSRPSSSVPKRWSLEGGCDGGKLCASGSCGAINGAKIAITIQASAIALPASASGCRHAGRSSAAAPRARRRKAIVLI